MVRSKYCIRNTARAQLDTGPQPIYICLKQFQVYLQHVRVVDCLFCSHIMHRIHFPIVGKHKHKVKCLSCSHKYIHAQPILFSPFRSQSSCCLLGDSESEKCINMLDRESFRLETPSLQCVFVKQSEESRLFAFSTFTRENISSPASSGLEA